MVKSIDPNQTPHTAASDLGLHFLQMHTVFSLKIGTLNLPTIPVLEFEPVHYTIILAVCIYKLQFE